MTHIATRPLTEYIVAPAELHPLVLVAAQRFGVPPAAITGPRRDAALVAARHAVAWVLKREAGLTLAAIGQLLGGRDHTSIMHAVAAAERRAVADPWYALTLADLRQEVHRVRC